jgi:hypothetical protein
MKPRDEYPEGVTCWVDTDLPDPEAATEFYGGLFGWKFEDRMPADQEGHYFVAQLSGLDVAAVGSRPDGATWPPAWNTYVAVGSADEAAAAVKDAGGAVLMEPFDVLEAGRMAVVADPQGAAFNVWEARQHRGAQLVNEPGSWNFSGLSTTDPEGAIGFYRSVFGWEADWGEDEWSFFRAPGYGDFLERDDPDLRKRLAEADAPPHFEDVTATLHSMAGQPEGTPPHWGVTFSVEDADAAAARAVELGGKVLVEPFDARPVRMAVLSDPQGAVFTVSKFDPEME